MNDNKVAWQDGYRLGYADAVNDAGREPQAVQAPDIPDPTGVQPKGFPRSSKDTASTPDKRIMDLEDRLDRLTDHVNREVGVAETIPLHERVESSEWFAGVDEFTGRADKELEEHRRELEEHRRELEEHRRELRRIVHGAPKKAG
jgi:hypothetical protein